MTGQYSYSWNINVTWVVFCSYIFLGNTQINRSIKLLQNSFHLNKLCAAVHIQKYTLSALFSCHFVSWPSFQVINFLNDYLVKSKEEFRKSTNLFIFLVSHCVFYNDVEILEDRAHVFLSIGCQIVKIDWNRLFHLDGI